MYSVLDNTVLSNKFKVIACNKMKQINISEIKPYYYVTEEGEIYSSYSNKYLKKDLDKDGYERVSLQTIEGKRKSYRVNRIVALTYIKNINNYPVVNHIDNNKRNNKVDNLEWTTVQQNTILGYQNNNYHYTKKIGVYDLNDNLIQIFNSIKECANNYNISYYDISKIANNKIKPYKKGKIANLNFKFIKSVSTS